MLTSEQLTEIRERWPAGQTFLTMQALPDLQALLTSHEEAVAVARELLEEFMHLYVPCMPDCPGGGCTRQRALLARCREAGLL